MTDYNKIITTVNSITPDYDFIPDLNNTIVIDTSENRIGINTITPDENIHVSGGTIKTQDLIVLGDLSVNNFSSDILPRDDLSYNIGSITHRWNDLFIGSGTIYMDKTRILRMADYTRHGNPALDISALIIDNSGRHLDISDIRHVNVEGDVSFASNFDLSDHMIIHGDVSFNKDCDVSGVLNLTQLLTSDGLVTTATKIYTIHERNSAGSMTTRLIIDPSGDGIAGNAAAQGEVVIYGNLDVKGETTYLKSTNVDISDNIIRMNANHNSVTDGGIAVTDNLNADKLFTYNNPGKYWTTTNTDINFGPQGGVVSSGFMNIDNVNIDGNTIDVDTGDLILKSDTGQVQMTAFQNINLQSQNAQTTIVSSQQTNLTSQNGNTQLVSYQNTTIQSQNGQVVVENVTFNSNTISTDGGLDLNIHAQGGDIYTQNTNLDLGTGVLTVNSVQHAHVPAGAIIIWYGNSGNVPAGWVICDGNNGTPNLSGRFIVCSGNNSETNYTPGQSSGQDKYAFSIQEMPVHNHGGNSGNTSAEHTHGVSATTGNESAQHTHGIGGSTGNANANHSHTLSANTGQAGADHWHPGSTGNASANHGHNISNSGNHAHPVDVAFEYSSNPGGFFGQQVHLLSVQLDQDWNGYVHIDQVRNGSASAGGGGDHSHNTGDDGAAHSHDFQTGGANAYQHAHGVSGNADPETTAHSHPLPTNTQNDQHDHTHSFNTTSQNQSQTHHHDITTTQTGGGTQHDNRPKWYSLFYIMKL
jgi:hypothetical protein